MELVLFVAPAALAAILTYWWTPIAGRLAYRIGALDQPGPRKIHRAPMPRLGGLAVIVSVATVALAGAWLPHAASRHLPDHLVAGIALGLLPIVAVSIRDDIAPVRALPKFLVHLVGASIAVAFGVSLNGDVHVFGRTVTLGPLAAPISVLWLMGTTSAFNIVDGLDGLSAGLALISASALAGIFVLADQNVMAAAALVLAGALAGFLPYNLFPARMFFGDTGATAIGFCLGAFALRGGATLSAGFAALLPVFVLGLPVAETAISMARRLLRRLEERDAGGVFEADRNHIHHRLLALGVDHGRAVLILYGAGAVFAAAALVSMLLSARESALLVVALVLAGSLGVRRLGYDEFAVIRRGVVLKAYEAPVLNRSMFVMFVDVMIVAAAAVAAVAVKTDWNVATHGGTAVALASLVAPITIGVFWSMGVYRQSWRLAGADEFSRACVAVLVTTLIAGTVRTVLAIPHLPVSLLVLFALVDLVLLIACRSSYQVLAASRWRVGRGGTPALIYGAGRRGVAALAELAAAADGALRPVAFIDDDPAKIDTLVHGIPVAGTFATLERTLRRFSARAIILAADPIPASRLAELDALCVRTGVGLLKLHLGFDTLAEYGAVAASATQTAPAVAVRFVESPRRVRRPAAVGAVERCPTCGSGALHRSHVRRMSERVRKQLTHKRLYRCEVCGWRGWANSGDAAIFDGPACLPPSPPLDGIEAVLSRQSLRLHAN